MPYFTKHMAIRQNRGVFQISAKDIETNPQAIMQIMSHCIITRAECMFDTDCIEYRALSAKFQVCPDGHIAPTYKWVFKADGSVDAV